MGPTAAITRTAKAPAAAKFSASLRCCAGWVGRTGGRLDPVSRSCSDRPGTSRDQRRGSRPRPRSQPRLPPVDAQLQPPCWRRRALFRVARELAARWRLRTGGWLGLRDAPPPGGPWLRALKRPPPRPPAPPALCPTPLLT